MLKPGDEGYVPPEDDEPRRKPTATVTAAKYNNDVTEMARHINDLEEDNFKFRNKNRDLTATLKTATPAEGSVVLTKEQAADWTTYQALGKPKDLETFKTENATLKEKQFELARSVALRDIADGVEPGVKFDIDIFKDLDSKIPGITYEKKTVKDENDVEVSRWFATYKEGEVSKEVPVFELYRTRFPKYMDALTASSNPSPNEHPQSSGTPYPQQPAGGGRPPEKSLSGEFIRNRYGHNAHDKDQGK